MRLKNIIWMAIMVGALASCKKSWLDVNTNPNALPSSTTDLVFTNAFIPAGFLNEESSFDELEGVFVWHYGENDLFYDKGEVIRFKVNAFILPDEDEQNLEILGRANEDGLGLVQWWSG